MRSNRIPTQEQSRLIMECRKSGLTDYQWCVEHGIKLGIFYNWVKWLRQKGCADFSPAVGHSYIASEKQEVVKVDFKNPVSCDSMEPAFNSAPSTSETLPDILPMKLSVGKCILSILNGTDFHFLTQIRHVLMEFEC